MKIAVDTNILFSFFWKNSFTKKLLINSLFELVSPELAIEELKKYSKEIMKKAKISKKDFDRLLKDLKLYVKIINKKEYSSFIPNCESFSPDKDDLEFFALCKKFSCSLWSNDFILKRQNEIKVLTTKEIIELLY